MRRTIGWVLLSVLSMFVASSASAAGKGSQPKGGPAKVEAPVAGGSQWWVGAFSGSDLSVLGDLTNGVKAWDDMVTDTLGGDGYSSTNNVGILKGIELGCQLDPFNAIYLGLESVSNSTQYVQATDGSDFVEENVTPGMFGATLNYRLSLVAGPASRTSFSIGGGFYQAEVAMSGIDTLTMGSFYRIDFTGSGFGGILAFEQEWIVAGAVGIELSVRGRLADIDKLTATEGIVDGVEQSGGTVGLAIGTMGAYDFLLPMDTSTIDGGGSIRYAHADYSGVAMALNFKLYL